MKSMNTKILTIFMVIALVAITGLIVMNVAQAAGLNTEKPEGLAGGSSTELIKRVTNWVLGITGAIAILFIIYGGFRYITARKNYIFLYFPNTKPTVIFRVT